MRQLKDHPIIAGLLAVLIFAFVTFPMWLATVWPLASDRPFTEWAKEKGVPVFNQWASLAVVAVIGIVLVGSVVWLVIEVRGKKDVWSDDKTIITDRHYVNEAVEIDGIEFRDCTFESVTLMYRGKGPAGFINCHFPGQTRASTDHIVAMTFSSITTQLAAQLPGDVVYGLRDTSGKMFPLGGFQKKAEGKPEIKPPAAQ